jgi:hypothetical protein
MKTKTSFQEIIQSAQPSMKERFQHVIALIVDSIETGFYATIEFLVRVIDLWVAVID